MMKLTLLRLERLPTMSVATKLARNVPGFSFLPPIVPPNRLLLLPAAPGWLKLPTLR